MLKPIEDGRTIDYKIAVREKLMPGNVISYLDVVNLGTPIWFMKDAIGMSYTLMILSRMISSFVDSFNVSKNMKSSQITDFAISLIEEAPRLDGECPSMRLEDYAVFFERAKSGVYGRPFDYVDGALINEWLDKYWEERIENYKKAKYDDEQDREQKKQEAYIKQGGEYVEAEEFSKAMTPIIEILRKKKEPTEEELKGAEERRKRLVLKNRELSGYGESYSLSDKPTESALESKK